MRLAFLAFVLFTRLLPAWGQPAAGLVANGDFAREGRAEQPPEGWQSFAHEGRYTIAVDPAGGRGGSPCVKVEGTAEGAGGRAGVLTRTETFPAPRRLEVRALTRGTEGRRAVMLQFFDADNLKEIVATESVAASGAGPGWREVRAEVGIPRALKGKLIRVILLLYLYGSGSCAWDDISLTPVNQVNLQVRDEETSPLMVRPYPPDGAVVAQNPPDFRWRPEKDAVSYTLQLCRKPDFAGPSLIAEERLPLNCHNLSRRLEPGRWHWRIRFADEEGNLSGFGKTRSFEVPGGACEFTLPPMVEVRKRLAGPHPRLYVTPETLPALRARREASGKPWWDRFSPRLEQLLKTDPAVEPADCDLRGLPLDLAYFERDTRLRQASGQVASGLWDLAFGYLVTGEGCYADGAKRYLLHVSRWNPEGATSFGSNDQVFRDILIKSAMAYDWIADTLAPEEREAILKGIADRGRIMFRIYAAGDRLLNNPYDSHGQSNIGYMGLVALALAGDVPEAEEWAGYTIRVYCNSFPPWGDADGGWSQGVSYWKWSCSFAFQYVDALKTAAGIDLYRKPWFRNNGLFKLYFHPPWCSMSHFGDTGPYGLDAADRWNLARYAALYSNPVYQWYSGLIRAPYGGGPYGYLFPQADLPARPPVEVPQARVSRDIGWVAMHSRLYAPDDIMLLAKSSPYGSQSHSHADQNSFVLYAFAEPLAIDSGYYPWYFSPHHKEWAIRTKAHNTVLVDGEGQPEQEMIARGKSAAFLGGKSYAYWCGDAAEAYAGKLRSFRRHILHLRPDAFVVYDELESAKPAAFQWLLHATDRMEVDSARQSVLVRRGKARLSVQHLLPAGLRQSQDDSFGVPPEARGGPMPNQWHYRAETAAKAQRAQFLTFLRASSEDGRAGTPGARGATRDAGAALPPGGMAAGRGQTVRVGAALRPGPLLAMNAGADGAAPLRTNRRGRGADADGAAPLRALGAAKDPKRAVSPVVEPRPGLLRGTGCVGLQVGGERVAFATGPAKQRSLGDLRFDGAVAAAREGPDSSRYLLVSGILLQRGARTLARASSPCSLAAGWVAGIFEYSVTAETDTDLRLYVGARPAGVALDGRTLPASRWSYDAPAGILRVRIGAGEHSLSLTSAGKTRPPLPGALQVSIGKEKLTAGMGTARTYNNTVAAWAGLRATRGIYRTRVAGPGAAHSRVWLDRDALADGDEVVLTESGFLLVEAPAGVPLPRVAFEDAYPGEGIAAAPLHEKDPRLAAGEKIEAESYAAGLHGTPEIYSHRTFLSGGKGVSTPDAPGLGCRWNIRVERAGRYCLILKAATHEPSAARAITVDGKPVAAGSPVARFSDTGGYGGSPDQWKHHLLCKSDGKPAVLQLAAGEHRLELVTLSGPLNLDYWLLVPVEQAGDAR